MSLSEQDVDKIVDRLEEKLANRSKRDFVDLNISPLDHYEDHVAARRLMELLDENTIMGLKKLLEVLDEEAIKSIKTMFHGAKAAKWVVIFIVAFFVGLGFLVHAISNPASAFRSLIGG